MSCVLSAPSHFERLTAFVRPTGILTPVLDTPAYIWGDSGLKSWLWGTLVTSQPAHLSSKHVVVPTK